MTMQNPYVVLLLVGILVLMILSPFAGLATLMMMLFISAIVLAVQTLIQILLVGDRTDAQ